MKGICALALATLLGCDAVAARADENLSAATIADVRCVVVASVFANDPANASSAALLTFYFLGRIDAREPASFDLSHAMRVQLGLMSQDDLKAEGKRCGNELAVRATHMSEVGKSLTEQNK